MTSAISSTARLCGIAGLAGALGTGLGEGLLQYAPGADFADPNYNYFTSIAISRQSAGHFISVLSAPLYLLGYWHLTRNIAPARPRLSNALFLFCAYAFMLGAVWMGERYFLAATAHAIETGAASPALLEDFARHNEPFVNALRAAIVIFSAAWIYFIVSGQSRYPRFMALFSPGAVLGAIFLLWMAAPAIGDKFLPTAMNTAHAIVFAMSLIFVRGTSRAVGKS
ncbi:MAG: hypothetical protein A3E78_07750 [Alphaproteobacteria bacterium RIFCSPHIGHO2_12_FULL_63_12]|nr:MAG: hypothetical protein A3E78_07750 [Alphaproteobacteria bacterium RIFCSPHIGHO2_12_FULL_63_12]